MESVQSCSRPGLSNRAANMPGDPQVRSILMQETIGICNLPSVVLEKIALHLPWEDYGALRQINKQMSQSLPSVNAMNEKINQGLSGERAEPYKKMVDAAKSYYYITKEAHSAIRDALQTIEVGKYQGYNGGESGSNGQISLCCRYCPQLPGAQEVMNVLDKFYDLIPGEFSIEPVGIEQTVLNSLIFLTCDDLTSTQQIFASANQVFNQSKGGEKWVVASLINALKLHLCGRFAEADINNLAALYPDVFSMGEIIHKIYPARVHVVR